jgi:hypothetical protein
MGRSAFTIAFTLASAAQQRAARMSRIATIKSQGENAQIKPYATEQKRSPKAEKIWCGRPAGGLFEGT